MIQSKGNFSSELLLGNQMSNSENLDVGLDVPLFPQQFPMPEVSRKQMRADKNSVVYRDAAWSDSIKRWVLEDEEYGAPGLSPQKPNTIIETGKAALVLLAFISSSKTSETSRDAVAYDKTMALLIALLLTIDPQEMSDNEGPTCAAVAEGMHVQQRLGDCGDGCDAGDCGDDDTRNSCNGKVAMTPTAVMAVSEWTLNMLVAASTLVTAVGEGGCMVHAEVGAWRVPRQGQDARWGSGSEASTTSLSKVCLTSTTKVPVMRFHRQKRGRAQGGLTQIKGPVRGRVDVLLHTAAATAATATAAAPPCRGDHITTTTSALGDTSAGEYERRTSTTTTTTSYGRSGSSCGSGTTLL
ncbi:hypothetical protein BJV78DRAFT_1158997 [Lactifluus subvellereus]|nr:hypothetical protein BJV78DRAFT_1158997 [Lactifluus subvellereus]